MIAPKTTMRFQRSFFQSKLKKPDALPAPPIEQAVLKLEDIPNCLPTNSKANITKAIRGPETYQGQGFIIHSIIKYFMQIKAINKGFIVTKVTHYSNRVLVTYNKTQQG
jgi:DNA topoisomerase VI subunit B